MGATEYQALIVHTRKNYKKKDKKQKISREILPMFDAILVIKRDTLQETVPSRKRDTMLIFPKTKNQQKNIQKREG